MAYGLGATDKFKGTGVYSGIQFEREKPDEEAAPNDDKKPKAIQSSTSSAKKETPASKK